MRPTSGRIAGRGWVGILAGALILTSPGAGQTSRFRSVLDQYAKFDAGDYELLQRGDVVAKMLPTDEKREVVALAVTRIAIPPGFYQRKFQDIVNFKKSDAVITVVLEDEDAEGTPTNYLVYLNRSRTLDLAGSFSGLRRRIVEGRTKDGMEKNMRYMKARLEAMYQAERSSSR
ncbi:MAG: hypothetical protein V3V11_10040 [Vicinamibacteria bacterium]